jgi:hypothetical protein
MVLLTAWQKANLLLGSSAKPAPRRLWNLPSWRRAIPGPWQLANLLYDWMVNLLCDELPNLLSYWTENPTSS